LRAEGTIKQSHTAIMEQGVDKVIDQTVEWMEILGSAGKAPPL
jgi:fructose-bisphosphate aldolase class II